MSPLNELGKGIRILVVDDEEAFREALAFEFKRKGFTVAVAANGKEGLEVLEKKEIDIVVSDIMMPEMSGIQLLDAVKSRIPPLPIIMLMTGFSEITSEEARVRGADAIFGKPFDRKVLLETVISLVHKLREPTDMANLERGKCKVEISFEKINSPLFTTAHRLLSGGLFIHVDEHFPEVSDSVKVDIRFSDNISLSGRGVVKWVSFKGSENQSSGIGIELPSLTEQEKQLIKNMIDS